MAYKKNTAEKIRELVESVINELGYDIWDVEYSKVGTERHLEITIDSKNGIDINDCEKVHRAIEGIIDEADPIEESYYLDVSSPGLERNIRTPEHFRKCAGEKAELKLFSQLDGKKSIIGVLGEFSEADDTVKITEESGKEYIIPKKLISKANIYFQIQNKSEEKEIR